MLKTKTFLEDQACVVETEQELVSMGFYRCGEQLYRWVPTLRNDGEMDFERMQLIRITPQSIKVKPLLELLSNL